MLLRLGTTQKKREKRWIEQHTIVCPVVDGVAHDYYDVIVLEIPFLYLYIMKNNPRKYDRIGQHKN